MVHRLLRRRYWCRLAISRKSYNWPKNVSHEWQNFNPLLTDLVRVFKNVWYCSKTEQRFKFELKKNIAIKYSIRKTLQRKNKYQNVHVDDTLKNNQIIIYV